jgi:hypothetical protein
MQSFYHQGGWRPLRRMKVEDRLDWGMPRIAITVASCVDRLHIITAPLFRYLIYIYYWYIVVTWCDSIGELHNRL